MVVETLRLSNLLNIGGGGKVCRTNVKGATLGCDVNSYVRHREHKERRVWENGEW